MLLQDGCITLGIWTELPTFTCAATSALEAGPAFSTSFVYFGLLGLLQRIAFRAAVDWAGRTYFETNILPDVHFLDVL
jgi:hypothetical protein